MTMQPCSGLLGGTMIDALIAGRLYGNPQSRTSKNGNAFATAKVRTPMAYGEASFVTAKY